MAIGVPQDPLLLSVLPERELLPEREPLLPEREPRGSA
jgi:hypothetical protein